MDAYEQMMKPIIQSVLEQQIDFSIYPPGGPTADDVASHIARQLRANEFAQATGIGSALEKIQAAQ